MIVQVVYLEVKPEALNEFIGEASANAEESRKEAGVIQFDLLQQQDSPTRFMLYEVYRDEAALEAHRHTAHFKRWTEVGVPLLAKPRERMLYRLI
jgi:autoinducer 2-degrading protein